MERLKQRYAYAIILLKQLVKTDFKLRYQSSFLGYIWSLLRPLALFLTLYLVFVVFLKVDYGIPHSAVYLLLGIVLWNYFAEVTTGSVGAIVGRGDLLRKINFPKYVIVVAGSFSAVINLLLNLIVVGIFMAFDHVALRPTLLLVPLAILQLFIFALALAFFLSAVYVKFRDIGYIWEVAMQAAFYATPILYPLIILPPKAAKLLMLNPMAQIIQDMRYLVVSEKTPTIHSLWGTHLVRLIPLGITLLIIAGAVYYFRKRSPYFAEDI